MLHYRRAVLSLHGLRAAVAVNVAACGCTHQSVTNARGIAAEASPSHPRPRAPRGVSRRASAVPSFVVMDVMSAAAEREAALRRDGRIGRDDRVIHLEVGQPASGPPAPVLRAAVRALEPADANPDPLGYTVARGEPTLRRRIAEMYSQEYGVASITEDHIAVTTGSSGAFVAAFSCLWDPGDRVVCPLPGYPCYRNVLQALGVNPVLLKTNLQDRFSPTVQQLEVLEKQVGPLAGLIVASPSSPTGCALSHTRLEQLISFCADRGMHFICDEIYHGLSLDPTANGPFPSALQISDSSIVVSSFSKYQCMSGWRLGYLVCKDKQIMTALERLLQNMHISAPTLSQRAAVAAFECKEELNAHVQRYASNIRILGDTLPHLGFECYEPDGAFYLYTRATHVMQKLGLNSSVDFCRLMLNHISVATTPGVDFDPIRGHEYVRFSLSGSTEDVSDACLRLRKWLHPYS